MQKQIMIIEDSRTVSKVMQHLVNNEPLLDAVFCTTMAEAAIQLESMPNIFAAIVDLNLPDAPSGEAVALTLSRQIPTIVLTGSYDNERREFLLSKGIVDYITKEGRHSYQLALAQVMRLDKNTMQTVLVVDDSSTGRKQLTQLLNRHLFNVVEASNGKEALQCIVDHPDIRLILTDYQMPEMDGIALIQHLRQKYEYDDLSIIGLSSAEDTALTARFIKLGANDFLHKPFIQEEFYCRINSNMDAIERIQLMRDNANQDALTKVYNRRYFFQQGPKLLEQSRQKQLPISAAIVDIDQFKLINDHYGHQTGDLVLQGLARALKNGLGRFLIARASGEEFFILMAGIDSSRAGILLDTLRTALAERPIKTPAGPLVVKFSAGVTSEWEVSLDLLLQRAHRYLDQAKTQGRDQVISDDNAADSD